MSHAIEAVRVRKDGPLQVAVIGLGTGTLACLSAPDETWRFYEIDPAVVDHRPRPRPLHFPVVLRSEFADHHRRRQTDFGKGAGHQFDLIIVDAYSSSDAIPVHLATTEAMAIYKSKLVPQGVIVMHISNRHLELRSVVEGIAAANGLKTWIRRRDKDNPTT